MHLSDLGHISLIIAFIVAVYSVVAPLLGARLRSLNLVTSARNGVFVIFALHTLAMAIILYAFLSKDFSFRIVELHASTDLPPLYALCALYADKTGSLFFWGWLISLFTAVMTLQKFNTYRQIMPYTIAILAGIQAFFLSMVALRANIFMQNPFPPADGYGLNPLLQNFGMLIHPPLLYIGFAGFMVVFAFVMGALISRSPSSEWIRGIRRWTLFAWCTLGLGNLIGAWWAYEELGWGGYWAWDPVENAGLMPWLLGTAFLHTMAMLRKRDYLQTWSFALIIFTFIFVLLSPFITHGGIASELHGFQGSPFVPYIFAFILLSLIASLAFLFIRRRELEASEKPATLISREGSFLLANIIFVIIVGIVVSLTVFPKLYELVSGGLIAIERSLFDWTGGIALLILVFFMGICPLLGWRRTSWSSIKRNFLYPFTIAFIIAIVILISGIGNWYAVAALVGGFPLFVILLEWFRGTRARHRTKGENYVQAFFSLIWNNRPRYGGFIVHIGIILITIGVIGSSIYDIEKTGTLGQGETMTIQGYDLTYNSLAVTQDESKLNAIASISVNRGDKLIGTIYPENNYWFRQENYYAEVAIRRTLVNDLFVVLADYHDGASLEDNWAILRVVVNPLVVWMWIGGGFVLFGGIIAFWPDRNSAVRSISSQGSA